MKLIRFFCILALILSSCANKKDIIYLQDFENKDFENLDYNEYLINPGDVLKIDLKTEASFSKDLIFDSNQNNVNLNRENLIIEGYSVDDDGNIDFPQLGQIKVEGMNVHEVSDYIKLRFSENKIFDNISLSVKVVNWSFTIIGEVNSPGRYFYDKYNLNFIQALGMAGDLTINGRRDKIKLIRFKKNNYNISEIDITSSDFINSDYFQIHPGDVIIVDPNRNRVKNAGIIGNSGTLLSLLSFLLSSIIIINN